jgi:hypothetical protein
MGDRVREEWDETRLACAGLQNRAGPCSCHQAILLTFSAVQNHLLFANAKKVWRFLDSLESYIVQCKVHDIFSICNYHCVKRNVQSAHFFVCGFSLLDMYVCSTWVMMNQKTRRLSKMPNEVRDEISPHFLERSAIKEKNLVTQKIKKLDDSAQLVRSGLTVRTFIFFPICATNLFSSLLLFQIILMKIQISLKDLE